MPYRKLPRTDASRLKALKSIIDNDDVYTVGNRAVDWNTLSVARTCYEKLCTAHVRYRNYYSNQLSSTQKYQELQRTARMFVSHFIQVLNMAMQRGEVREDTKPLYGLKVGDYAVPDLSTEAQLVVWGERIIRGEKERLKRGGVPIYNPTIAKVAVHYDIFRDRYERRQSLREKTAGSLQAVSDLRAQVDEVILNVWNQVEHHYADLPLSERIAKCRNMGVVYYYRPGEPRD